MLDTVPVACCTPLVSRGGARRWLSLSLVLCGAFMTLFDLSVVNVAIPTMQRDLRVSFAQDQRSN